MAPITRSKTAQSRAIKALGAIEAVNQASPSPPPVQKVKRAKAEKEKKVRKESATRAESANFEKGVEKTGNGSIAWNIERGMELRFLPNEVPDTVNEMFVARLARLTEAPKPGPLVNGKRLEQWEALEMKDAAMPTLKTDIHDIWDRARHDNWRFDSKTDDTKDWRIYETLTPALRLASLWLTRPEYQRFWHTILYAPIKTDPTDNRYELAKDVSDISAEHSKDMEERLRDVARKIRFSFQTIDLEAEEGEWASTTAINNYNPDAGYDTILVDEFMDVPNPRAAAAMWTDRSASDKLRFLFLLAVKLGGQLAETLWINRCQREQGEYDPQQKLGVAFNPLFRHPHDSMKDAFEGFVLGGRLDVYSGWRPKSGPMCLDALHLGWLYPDSSGHGALLHMEGINSHFSQGWWEERDDYLARGCRC
ncbi:MAG: hypothetical protein Q9201_002611 [Fulgogasparrea decipioides]